MSTQARPGERPTKNKKGLSGALATQVIFHARTEGRGKRAGGYAAQTQLFSFALQAKGGT